MRIIQGTINRLLGPGDSNNFPVLRGHKVYVWPEMDPGARGRIKVSDEIDTTPYSVPLDAVDFDS